MPSSAPPAHDSLPTFCGPSIIAKWCGVHPASVSNWLSRYNDYPAPAGQVRGPKRDTFFWREDQRDEWVKWALSKSALPGPFGDRG